MDAEAVAAGSEPLFAADAAPHARECPACQASIGAARAISEALEGFSGASEALAGIADRVTRLRAFSRKERRTYALWNVPLLLTLGLSASGIALLALPALSATDQVSVGAAALAPILALASSLARWAGDLLRLAPTGLQALSEGMRQESTIGFAALALLVPLSLGLNRILARARVPGRK